MFASEQTLSKGQFPLVSLVGMKIFLNRNGDFVDFDTAMVVCQKKDIFQTTNLSIFLEKVYDEFLEVPQSQKGIFLMI